MAIGSVDGLNAAMENALHVARLKGLCVAVARGGGAPQTLYLGTDSVGTPLSPNSLFPVASVTKLATALAVLRLVDAGRLSLDDPLARHIPEAVAAGHWGVTLRRLLSHASGLPADLAAGSDMYAPGLAWPALADACIGTPLAFEPLSRVQYSNVGYGLLAIVVERETGQAFASALDQLVLRPLGIEGYLNADLPRPAAHLGGIRGRHAKTELEPFNSSFWLSLAMPWAGLVTTPAGALSLARAFAGHPAGFLRTALLQEATRNQNGDLGGGFVRPLIWKPCPWGLGAELRDSKSPHWAPESASPDSFGHSGASGCVAWYDPGTSTAWSIHGSRVADSGWLIRRGPEIGGAILAG